MGPNDDSINAPLLLASRAVRREASLTPSTDRGVTLCYFVVPVRFSLFFPQCNFSKGNNMLCASLLGYSNFFPGRLGQIQTACVCTHTQLKLCVCVCVTENIRYLLSELKLSMHCIYSSPFRHWIETSPIIVLYVVFIFWVRLNGPWSIQKSKAIRFADKVDANCVQWYLKDMSYGTQTCWKQLQSLPIPKNSNNSLRCCRSALTVVNDTDSRCCRWRI